MKSIKPGRGPSFMGGVVGCVMIVIGIAWTALAAQAHWIMAVFGLCWTAVAVINTVYHFKNAKSKNRYSAYDIVDSQEEPDPLNEYFGGTESQDKPGTDSRFCPYCGKAVESEFDFCPGCGKKLP